MLSRSRWGAAVIVGVLGTGTAWAALTMGEQTDVNFIDSTAGAMEAVAQNISNNSNLEVGLQDEADDIVLLLQEIQVLCQEILVEG